MEVSELIEKLQSIKEKEWDIQVVVQSRDGWWCYHWYDDDVEPIFRDWKIIL